MMEVVDILDVWLPLNAALLNSWSIFAADAFAVVAMDADRIIVSSNVFIFIFKNAEIAWESIDCCHIRVTYYTLILI